MIIIQQDKKVAFSEKGFGIEWDESKVFKVFSQSRVNTTSCSNSTFPLNSITSTLLTFFDWKKTVKQQPAKNTKENPFDFICYCVCCHGMFHNNDATTVFFNVAIATSYMKKKPFVLQWKMKHQKW